MSIVHRTNPINIIDNVSLSIKKPFHDFWNWVSREPVEAVKKLKSWAWKKVSGFEWAQKYTLTRTLTKLDGLQITGEKLLTREESLLVMQTVFRCLKGEKISTFEEKVFNHLIDKEYLKDCHSNQAKNELLPALENLFKYQFYIYNPIFDKYFHPVLFVTSDTGTLLKVEKHELLDLVQFMNDKIDSKQATASFKTLLKILKDPYKPAKYNDLTRSPFTFDDLNLLHANSPEIKSSSSDFTDFFCRMKEMADHLAQLGDLNALENQLEKGSVDIRTATRIGVISLFVTKISSHIVEDELSPEEKSLFRILKRFQYKSAYNPIYTLDRWLFVEKHIKEIRLLRLELEKGHKISLAQLEMYSKVSSLYKEYSHFLKTNPNWPCDILQEIKNWSTLKLVTSDPYLSDDLKKYHSSLEKEVKNRIKNVDPDHKPKLKDIQFLDTLLSQLKPFKDILDSTLVADIETFLKLYSETQTDESHFDEACPINLCFFKNWTLSQIWSSEKTLITKITATASSIFMPFTHTNFSLLESNKRHKLGLGIRVYEDEIRGVGSSKVKSYPINPTRLLKHKLSTEDSLRFKRLFFKHFIEIKNKLNREHYYPNGYKNIFKKFFSGFIPSIFSDKPEPFLSSKESKEMFCSEFAFQMVVETCLKTCEEMNIEKPDTLSLFGARSLKGLTPNDLRSLWLKRGILAA